MSPAKTEYDLLEHLANTAGCTYLSDLTLPSFRKALHNTVEQTPFNAFSVLEWKKAVRYLTGFEGEGCSSYLRLVLLENTL